MFSVQNGGHCNSDVNAHLNYDKYGAATGCVGGEGAGWLNDVYEIWNRNRKLYRMVPKSATYFASTISVLV